MPRRERLVRRRPPLREPIPRLLVVCGADKTERAYLHAVRDQQATRSVDVRLVERPRSPDQVVAYARDHCGYQDFDETWCVVDVDRFESEGRKVSSACSAAAASRIRMAISNPCFEYWLLLHRTDSSAPMPECDAAQDRLRKHVRSYDKTRLRFDDFKPGVADAIARAKTRDDTGEDWRRNPSTNMWQLVERIMGEE